MTVTPRRYLAQSGEGFTIEALSLFIHLLKLKKMKRYYFRIYQGLDFEDGDTVWTDANSEQEARSNIESDYWGINRLDLLRVR